MSEPDEHETEIVPPHVDDTEVPREPGSAQESRSILADLETRIGGRPRVSLRDVDSTGPSNGAPSHANGRYVVEGLLGEGGVGAVHRGRDVDLGRIVAMKFLHERYRDDPNVLHRFVEEAQIGGQLQHPGIVPVYELGVVDGTPFFAMKLIKGVTLAARLAERRTPADDRRRYLAIFEQICQTVAYAHARGVVHRDLKPANVMIGSFGEVQVVDWGMGKVLASDADAPSVAATRDVDLSVIETFRSRGEGTQSLMGSIMGTPAYMPPEQAIGDVDAMDARSDVFALGAMLCEILTGRPPYTGRAKDVLRMAATADLDDARGRLARCGAEEDLVELALRCLAPKPDVRPASAEVVASAVQEHLAAAEKRAYDANVRAIALKRTQKLGIALTVVVALGLAASLWFWRDADEQRHRAVRAQTLEADARLAAETHLANFDRLSIVVRLEEVRSAARELYPAWPDRIADLRGWLGDDAAGLARALPELRATLGALDTDALPPTPERIEADRFLRRTLATLVADVEAFVATEVPEVERRLRWAERVEELTIARHAARWEEARLAILRADGVTASERYRDVPIELAPQLGLIPIGMNPQSKLWEFYHLRSAWDGQQDVDPVALEVPAPDPTGQYAMDDRGIVFVLIPGGRFLMGAQSEDPAGPNFDSQAEAEEGPVQDVELQPYFLARHELTQGQWARLSDGEYPELVYIVGNGYHGIPVPIADSHPVEQVDWPMCATLVARHGLVLPTEAQWEYGCRAGTTTPFFSGVEAGDVEGYANVLDQTGQNVEPVWIGGEAFDDEFKGPSPVGTFAPNAFGLYDVHGNVWEWCRDWFGPYTTPARPGDGLREPELHEDIRASRGGCYQDQAFMARSAYRAYRATLTRSVNAGVRAAREVGR